MCICRAAIRDQDVRADGWTVLRLGSSPHPKFWPGDYRRSKKAMCSNKCPLPTTHTPLGRGKATGTVRAPLGPKALCTQPQWLLPGRMIVPLLGTFKVPGGSLGSHAAQCHSSRTRPIRETRQETIHVTCPPQASAQGLPAYRMAFTPVTRTSAATPRLPALPTLFMHPILPTMPTSPGPASHALCRMSLAAKGIAQVASKQPRIRTSCVCPGMATGALKPRGRHCRGSKAVPWLWAKQGTHVEQ